ncbi:MAG: nucleotidyltransferase domain-containing protein [Comamonadaceae bacterium]|nr:MAG: nucleotidyltransferase domain-containing protein [Comamonadaceae bacterium]
MPEASEAFGLPATALQSIRSVLARHPQVVRAEIYGSRAMARHRPGSDIDIALRGEALTAGDLLAIDRKLDDLELPYRIDLSAYHLIDDAALRAHIDRVGRGLYEAVRVP